MLISSDSKIHVSAQIASTAIIEPGVEIGENTSIGDFCIIRSGVKIGSNCKISPNVIIGEAPQDRSYKGEESFVNIGDNNIIREFVTIHKAVGLGQFTTLGDNNYLMVASHIGHNSKVGNNVTLANNVALAGHVLVEDGVTMGGGAVVHQNCRVGKLAMLSGMSATNHDALPFMIYVGIPSGGVSTNRVALRRGGYEQKVLSALMSAYKIVYRDKLPVPRIIEKLESELEPIAEIKYLLDFIKNSKRGIVLKRFAHGEDA